MFRYSWLLPVTLLLTCVFPVTDDATDAEAFSEQEVAGAPVASPPVEMSDPNDPVLLADIAAERRSAAERSLSEYEQTKGVKKWRRTKLQGCQLARMGISENSRPLRRTQGDRPGTEGMLTDDHYGIAHVVVNNRPCNGCKNWMDVMHRLSPHVGRQKKLTRPRQHWTSTLPCKGDEKPEGWNDDRFAGDWEVARMFWPTFRDAVIKMWVNGDIEYMPGKAIAWGCVKTERNKTWCFDPRRARARGLCKLTGFGDLNGFWAKPGNGCGTLTIPAKVAASKPVRGKNAGTRSEPHSGATTPASDSN